MKWTTAEYLLQKTLESFNAHAFFTTTRTRVPLSLEGCLTLTPDIHAIHSATLTLNSMHKILS